MENRRALGKGLEQLFDLDNLNVNNVSDFEKNIYEDTNHEEIIELNIDDLRPNPYQPRTIFDEDALNELAESIRENGVFQPIIVKKSIKGYDVIAGERRLRASKIAGKKTHAKGLRSPSNAPEMGMNAITVLAEKVINDELVSGRLLEYFKWIDERLANKHYGEGLGLDFNDQDSGKLIMTPTGISKSSDGIKLELAFRYPVSFSESQVTQGLQAQLPKNSTLKVTRSIPSVMHDKNSKYIKVLSEVYEEITGLDGTPVTTTGATYARRMPNIIAFGPSFPGQKGIAHKEDEWMSDQDLMMNIKIYISALMRLGYLD